MVALVVTGLARAQAPASGSASAPVEGAARYEQLDWLWKTPIVAAAGGNLSASRPVEELAKVEVLRTGLTAAQIDAGGKILPIAREDTIEPGKSIEETLDKSGVVRAVYVAIPDRIDPLDSSALYRCAIRCYFDGAAEPQIELPLSVFFGGGFGRPDINMLVAGGNRTVEIPLPDRRAGAEFCYMLLPMPFHNGCRIEILNAGAEPINLLLYLRVAIGGATKDTLRLHARYRREFPVQKRKLSVAALRGKGRLVGLSRLLDAPRDAWGDIAPTVIELDQASPLVMRCQGFAPATLEPPHDGMSGPLEWISPSRAFGRATGVEWRIADPFQNVERAAVTIPVRSPSGDAAVAPWIGAALWWYSPSETQHDFPRLRTEDLRPPPLRVADVVEIEGRSASSEALRVAAKEARGIEYSGDAAVSIPADTDVKIDVPFLAVREVELKIRVNPRQDFGTIKARSDGGSGEITFDRRTSGVYSLGRWKLKPGPNTVTVRATRAAILDCWMTPVAGP